MPSHSHSHPNLSRSKSHRSDDNLAGGRLSRRAADPTVEAERRAQQDRQFALDEAKVLNGAFSLPCEQPCILNHHHSFSVTATLCVHNGLSRSFIP